MIKKITKSAIDVTILVFIFILSVSISTIGLTIKANQYKQEKLGQIIATVEKKPVPVLSGAKGVIKKIYFRVGQQVKKGDLLIEIDNPGLKSRIAALQNYPDNLSARTEAEVAKIELQYLMVYSPVDGVISVVTATDGAPIQELMPLLTIYADEGTSIISEVDPGQYLEIKNMSSIKGYSSRLNQTFVFVPSLVRPDIKLDETLGKNKKKIGMYFTLQNSSEAGSLLQNEDIDMLTSEISPEPDRPAGKIIKFWNSILFENNL